MTEFTIPSNRFERHCLRQYLANAAAGPTSRRPRPSRAIAEWAAQHGAALGLAMPPAGPTASSGERMSDAECRHVAQALQAPLRRGEALSPSPLERRLCWIVSTLRLGRFDGAILKLTVRVAVCAPLHALAEAAAPGDCEDEINAGAIGVLLKHPKRSALARLRYDRPLVQYGLLENRGGGDYAPSATVMRLARMRRSDVGALRDVLFGEPEPATLGWDDFAHLGEVRDLAASLAAAALAKRAPGVGILLYGPPGTGKTEFAKRLAEQVRARAVFIGESDGHGHEPDRSERIAHFSLAGALAGQAGQTILVVDEADDIFTGVDVDDRASRTGSKAFVNRLVERCPAPTLWITNAPRRLGPAVMRRMALAIPFRQPGREVRRRMVDRLAEKRRVALTAGEVDRLAALEAAPALIDAGLRTAALAGGGASAAVRGATTLMEALHGVRPPGAFAGPVAFDAALSGADCDLGVLADRIAAAFAGGETALSFCFYGLPGTGKSAYARHLAERLGLEVLEKRASDLLAMWVGATEKAIAAAFAEAAERRAMLILDEADSFLLDRAGARHGWEVSQVNEMLTWMERHPWPFVCTTNAVGALDPATARRFLFKVAFAAMTPTQARDAFVRTFGTQAPAGLDGLDPLTPGDFAVVSRKARIIGERDAAALVALLEAEVAAKPAGRTRKIGF